MPSPIDSLSLLWSRALARRMTPWLCSLVLLAQRAPAVRVLAEAQFAAPARAVEFLRWAVLAVAGAGSYHTLAGATQFVTSPASPVAGRVGEPLQIGLTITGTPTTPQSWSINSGMPPGLSPANGEVVNRNNTLLITGTPTVAGNYTVSLTVWKFPNATGEEKTNRTIQIRVAGPSLPAAPGGVAAGDATAGPGVPVTWQPVAGAESYTVWRSDTAGSAGAVLLGTVTATTYTDTSAQPGAVYFYFVKARNGAGDGPFSAGDAGGRAAPFFTEASTFDLGFGFRWNRLGYFYDGLFPFVYLYAYGSWIYVFPAGSGEAQGYYLYDFTNGEFGFTQPAYYPFYFVVGGANANAAIQLSP